MKTTVLILVLWLACGYVSYHLNLGNWTHGYPDQDHRAFANACYIAGPIWLLPALLESPYRWQDKPLSCEQRWEYFHRKWPELSKEWFNTSRNCDLK